jgi:hypothetical protein
MAVASEVGTYQRLSQVETWEFETSIDVYFYVWTQLPSNKNRTCN